MNYLLKIMLLFFTGLFFVSCAELKKTNQDASLQNVKKTDQVLVFTKTAGWRHKSIEKGVQTIKELGKENAFEIVHSEDSLDFNSPNLDKYQLVVFLNTTLNVLGEKQQNAFEQYIKSGGSFMGIHSACDTEYEWPWFGKLVGAYFNGHPEDPNVRDAVLNVVDKNHPSTAHLEDSWARKDEWYNYKEMNPNVTFDEPDFRKHLVGGLRYCLGR